MRAAPKYLRASYGHLNRIVQKLIIGAIRYLLAFVFLSSGSWKLFHYNEYINSILSYKTLSVFGPRFSVSLILVELCYPSTEALTLKVHLWETG